MTWYLLATMVEILTFAVSQKTSMLLMLNIQINFIFMLHSGGIYLYVKDNKIFVLDVLAKGGFKTYTMEEYIECCYDGYTL